MQCTMIQGMPAQHMGISLRMQVYKIVTAKLWAAATRRPSEHGLQVWTPQVLLGQAPEVPDLARMRTHVRAGAGAAHRAAVGGRRATAARRGGAGRLGGRAGPAAALGPAGLDRHCALCAC